MCSDIRAYSFTFGSAGLFVRLTTRPTALAACLAALVSASCASSSDEPNEGPPPDAVPAPVATSKGDGEIRGSGPSLDSPSGAAGGDGASLSPAAPLPGGEGVALAPSHSTGGSGSVGASGSIGVTDPSGPSDPIGMTGSGSETGSATGGTSASPEPPAPPPPGPGTLTAGVWDDNLNASLFMEYRDDVLQGAVDTQDGFVAFETADHEAAAEAAELRSHETLDIALVIDTTGSMGDELAYLQAEFESISSRIEEAYPNADQRWSLVVYKDDVDDYIVRWYDFRDDADDFRKQLQAQAASGGGDFPEASHEALAAMNQLSWRTDSETARLAFWVGDAPHHGARASAMKSAILTARDQGIHIYPVASSGIDELTEYSMRAAAQLTGGRYLFLTDDSGVGDSHKTPTIPCYFVTALDEALLRMVEIEMDGEYRAPEKDEIVRSVGRPEDGVCVSSQDVVSHAF